MHHPVGTSVCSTTSEFFRPCCLGDFMEVSFHRWDWWNPGYVCRCSGLSDSLQPHGLQLTRLLSPWDFPGKDTDMGCHFLLQGIFPTQASNTHVMCRLCRLCLQVDSLALVPPGKPWNPGPLMIKSITSLSHLLKGLSGGTSDKEFTCQYRRRRFDPWGWEDPLE